MKVRAALERDDFRSAEVKKLCDARFGKYYRARLDHSNRLLFTIVRHHDEPYALMLEIIENHAYDKSRFLRGAPVDEDKVPGVEAPPLPAETMPVRYIHPHRTRVHLLDKIISFDDAQETVYGLVPPAIVVGSAGSGKTALALEKLKQAEGEVLYVTLSGYLAQSARDQYYAHGFEREGQDLSFLSYREFVETIKVPAGREATWRDFAGWFGRMRQAYKGVEAHQAFEEIRGVITANPAGPLSREQYLSLGVRQSIFAGDRRDMLYDLYTRYRAWLADSGLYDLNLVAQQWRAAAVPTYDFAVVDEVQDLTNAQLALVLGSLKNAGRFVLCGDSNQIVHPNFFSWSKVKSLFWQDPELAARQELHVLRANYRNGAEATRVANTLLKIKQRRFGSINRSGKQLPGRRRGIRARRHRPVARHRRHQARPRREDRRVDAIRRPRAARRGQARRRRSFRWPGRSSCSSSKPESRPLPQRRGRAKALVGTECMPGFIAKWDEVTDQQAVDGLVLNPGREDRMGVFGREGRMAPHGFCQQV